MKKLLQEYLKKIKDNRRFILRYAGLSIVAVFLMFSAPSYTNSGTSESLEKKAREQADSFLARISENPLKEIDSVSFSYEVHMVSSLNVRMKMSATLKMEKKEKGYISTFKLTEPEGKDIWSWLLLNLFGKHTKEYKELVQSIEIILTESFHIGEHRFMTDNLEELLPVRKDYPNQTAIKVCFNYDEALVKFWEDKKQESFSKSMEYTDQVGPLTGFFNYLFFDKRCTRMRIMNVLKQVEDSTASEAVSGKKMVHYLFESEVAYLGFNNTDQHTEYLMSAYLEKGNLLDIIYGENIYYQLVLDAESNIKVPYAARIEGIISKPKKKNKLKMLRERHPDREISEKEIFAEADDILAARNVRVYLNKFNVTIIPRAAMSHE